MPTRLRPWSLEPPASWSGSSAARLQTPPAACQSTRMGSEAALLLPWQASQAAWSSKLRANLLVAERAHGTASALTPCPGHSTRLGARSTWHLL